MPAAATVGTTPSVRLPTSNRRGFDQVRPPSAERENATWSMLPPPKRESCQTA